MCQCRLKFHKNSDGVCVPNCDPPCERGQCIAPNVCQCDEGYAIQSNSSSRHVCQPVCVQPCVNGFCSGINECTCLEGFIKSPEDPSKCFKYICKGEELDSPIDCQCPENTVAVQRINDTSVITDCNKKELEPCGQKCIESPCLLKDSCQCELGYENQTIGDSFQCICLEGYQSVVLDSSQPPICRPICEKNCKNGFCSSPNVCSCNEGYSMNNESSGDCLPICGNCTEIQDCISPGQCQCKAEYKITPNGGCKEIICNMGLIRDRRCICLDGFYLDNSGTCRENIVEPTTEQEILEITTEVTEKESNEELLDIISEEEEGNPEDENNSELQRDATTLSDMELIPTTTRPVCINGQVIDGECQCSNDDIKIMDNECVQRTTIEYQVEETAQQQQKKRKCAEKCVTGECFNNGTCKCNPHFKVSPDDETECIPKSICEICFNDDSFPCPKHCFSSEYSPSVQSNVPQYLIILLACFILLAIAVLAFTFYRRMQKHDYYTGPVANSAPIYAYEMEALT